MPLEQTNALIGLAVGAATLLAFIAAWWKWIRPRWRDTRQKVTGALDAIVGRDAIYDPASGRKLADPLPGIGQRMESVETAVAHIADLLMTQKDQDKRIDKLEDRVDALETGALERVTARVESVAAWRAVEAVANGSVEDSPTDATPHPDAIEG